MTTPTRRDYHVDMTDTADLPAPLERTHLTPHNFTISYFLPRDDGHEQIDLNAPYQRASVWDDAEMARAAQVAAGHRAAL